MNREQSDQSSRPDPDDAAEESEPRSDQAERVVVDASAVLALLFAEPGAEVVAEAIADGAALSTANLCEVATVLVRRGQDPQPILMPVREQVTLEVFTAADALTAASLYPATAGHGLSLGDRACLALAKRLGLTALTAEQAWAKLDIGVPIELIRPMPSTR